MTLTTYTDIEQGTDEWHALRRGIVTASTIGRLITHQDRDPDQFECHSCGVLAGAPCVSVAKGKTGPIKTYHPDRYATAREAGPALTVTDVDDLALLLASERITGRTEETRITDAMWRGIDDEPRAVEVYSNTYAPVQTVGFMDDDRWGFTIGYSPDGLVGADGLVEVKSRAPKTQVKTIVNCEVPAANMAQLQTGLLVSGRKWIDYISYAGGMHMYVQRVLPDPDWFDVIVAAARQVEHRINELVTTYHEHAAGLPMTERVETEIRV